MISKQELRERYRKVREGIPAERREQAAKYLTECPALLDTGGLVLSFSSIKGEIDTAGLNASLGDRLVLPRVHDGGLEMRRAERLVEGPYGIMEPDERCERVTEVAFALVPGLAFDDRGHRLGYGKGYYDRCLATMGDRWTTFGIAFQEQMSDGLLPNEAHDVPVHKVLTF